MNKIIDAGKREIRNSLGKASPKAKPAQLDRLVADIFAILIRQHTTPSAMMAAMMTLEGNIQTLGEKAAITSATKLLEILNQAELTALMEADVDERQVADVFAKSDDCEICGLPKSSNKMNLNRMDVEDEVLGQQYDSVFSNDVCRCVLEKTAEEKEAEKRERELAAAPAEKGSVMELFEEQEQQEEEAGAKKAAAAAAAAAAGKRRDRHE